MSSPKILIFSATASAIGGVETWLRHFCAELPRHGYEPVAALAKGQQFNDPDKYLQLNPGLPHVVIDGAGLPKSSRVLACQRAIRKVRPAIVVLTGMIDAVPAAGFEKCRDGDLRIILRTQGLLPAMLADQHDYQSVFDLAVCDGLLNARYLREVIGLEPERQRHLPNGVDVPKVERVARQPGTPIRLAYVGRLSEGDKRVLDLVPLCEELKKSGINFELKIVGDGPARRDLESAFKTNTNVRMTGMLSNEDVYTTVLPFADCLMSLSSSEAFGISIVEAMMNGVVPVSSKFLGWKSVGTIEDGRNALTFDIGDTVAAAEQVSRLAGDGELLNRLSAQAAKDARERFSWDNCMEGWAECLRSVMELPQRPVSADLPATDSAPAGKLDRLGLPPALVYWLRRARHRLVPVTRPGGEEWPLYRRCHSERRLSEISRLCAALDAS